MKTNTDSSHDTHSAHPKLDAVAAGAHEAIDRAAHTASTASDHLSEKGHDLKAKQEQRLHTVSEYVQENPATSLGIALVGGYLLSRLLSSR